MVSREKFFNGFWRCLRERGWKSVVLHSWQELPAKIESDIDYAVSGCQPGELLRQIDRYARENGWLLVQVIEHEPSAFFCVCVQDGGDFEHLALDVTWEYRRLGHKLLSPEVLFKEVRSVEGKFFDVPSPGVEGAYLLAKAAAKNKDFSEIEERLGELCDENRAEFLEVLERTLGFRPLNGKETSGFPDSLREWYREAPVFRAVRRGHRYGLSEVGLYLKRCLQPTGVWLGFEQVPSEIWLEEALKPIKPLYRRYCEVSNLSLFGIPKVLGLAVRTSLIVESPVQKRLMRGIWRKLIRVGDSEDPGGVTRSILEHLNQRVVQRIGKMGH